MSFGSAVFVVSVFAVVCLIIKRFAFYGEPTPINVIKEAHFLLMIVCLVGLGLINGDLAVGLWLLGCTYLGVWLSMVLSGDARHYWNIHQEEIRRVESRLPAEDDPDWSKNQP